MSIFICGGGYTAAYRTISLCPVCECRRRMVVTLNGYWGFDEYCCGCGTRFSDGYSSSPTKTKAAKEIAWAKELWRSVTMTKKEAWQKDYEAVGM